jgi:hypothetical protein
MKRRSFFRLLWGVPSVALFQHDSSSEALASRNEPLHECVDRPELPCPACTKWSGDPLAIKTNLWKVPSLSRFFGRRAS